ncbi:MAG: 3-deoxy-8-phosphooctulonate synthase [Bacteroidota bacterium]|nr:3-deoxy-8-phosphooctulonate synthase [Bacteroidota bacterium]
MEYELSNLKHTDSNQFFMLAGPCVVESSENIFEIADELVRISDKYKVPLIFKASYRKANRTRYDSFRGIGDQKALSILKRVSETYDIPVVTDIHTAEEAALAANYADVLQIPAFLARQTSLLVAAARTGKYVNIKKGQFMSAGSMQYAAEKVSITGNTKIMLTERGTMFGYGDLIVDFRSIPEMQKTGFPVITDITHSLQQPNTGSGVTGGRPELIETMGKTAIAAGSDGIFFETHPNPSKAKSDGANMLPLRRAESLVRRLAQLRQVINSFE